MHPRIPLLLSLLGLVFAGYAGWLGLADGTCFERSATLIIASAALISIVASLADNLRWQRAVASALLLMMGGLIMGNLFGAKLLVFDPFHDPRYASFLVGLLVLTVVGLQRKWFLMRWLALALSGGGILSAGLNLAPFMMEPSRYTWTLAIDIAGSLLILASLISSKQRHHFESDASPLWSSSDPLLRSIRWTVVSFMAAIPMLLVYTWMQPIVPATASYALPLALFLSIAIAGAASRRVIGAVALVLGGLALLVQTAFTVALAREMSPEHGQIALYYAAFWVPAGLAALLCGARMTAPILRLLSRPS